MAADESAAGEVLRILIWTLGQTQTSKEWRVMNLESGGRVRQMELTVAETRNKGAVNPEAKEKT